MPRISASNCGRSAAQVARNFSASAVLECVGDVDDEPLVRFVRCADDFDFDVGAKVAGHGVADVFLQRGVVADRSTIVRRRVGWSGGRRSVR